MRVNVESISDTEKKLDVWIPVEDVKEKVEELFKDFQKRATIQGFRKGKVPRKVIESVYGKSLLGEVAQKLVSESMEDALIETSLHPVTRPDISTEDISAEKEFHYTVKFEVIPEVMLKQYKNITLTKDVLVVTDEDVEQTLEQMRKQHADAKSLEEDRGVGDGDLVVVDYEGTLDGQTIDDLKKSDVHLIVGEGHILKEFEDNLRDMRKEDEKEFDVTYDENFAIKEAAGKTVHFHIKLKDVMVRILPELDDEFAKDIGEESLKALRVRIKKEKEEHNERTSKEALKEKMIEFLVGKNVFDIPTSLLESEKTRLVQGYVQRYASMGMDAPPLDDEHIKGLDGRAEKNVRASVILNKIALQENIEVEEAEINEKLGEVASKVNMPLEQVRKAYEENDMISRIEGAIREEKVLDFLLKKAAIEEVAKEESQIDKET